VARRKGEKRREEKRRERKKDIVLLEVTFLGSSKESEHTQREERRVR